jgi:hypothetical protein
LKARIKVLQGELSELEAENSTLRAAADGHLADFARERERSDVLVLRQYLPRGERPRAAPRKEKAPVCLTSPGLSLLDQVTTAPVWDGAAALQLYDARRCS